MKNASSFPLRVNSEIIEKLRYIATENSRSINKELEFIIKKHIEKYEKNNGNIELNKINR